MKEDEFNKKLLNIIDDNTSGSNELLLKLNQLFLENVNNINFTSLTFQKLHKSFSAFESIQNYLFSLENIVKEKNKDDVIEFMKKLKEKKENIYDKIFLNLKPFLKDNLTIITISNSKTVLEIIKNINRYFKISRVIISESRPQLEGRILAEKLLKEKINIELIVEARIPEYVQKIDFCLIGADSILPNGNVINKIGSKVLALSCKYYDKPIYVLADLNKFSKDRRFQQDEKPEAEIWSNPPKEVKIQNLYFEEIDNKLITSIITNN